MDFAVELSKAHGLSPFDVLKQDKDSVIMLINYFIDKADSIEETTPDEPPKVHEDIRGGVVYRRVTNSTATGGWF